MSSSSSLEVRSATLRDAKAITEVHLEATRAAYRDLLTAEQILPVLTLAGQVDWREAIEFSEPQVHLANDQGQVVGFVGFDRSRDKGTPPTAGEIWALQVAESHWGQGVGLALWDCAREGLLEEGCISVSVWVPLRNERALRFFELAGFKRDMATAKTVAMGTVKVEEVRLKRNLA